MRVRAYPGCAATRRPRAVMFNAIRRWDRCKRSPPSCHLCRQRSTTGCSDDGLLRRRAAQATGCSDDGLLRRRVYGRRAVRLRATRHVVGFVVHARGLGLVHARKTQMPKPLRIVNGIETMNMML